MGIVLPVLIHPSTVVSPSAKSKHKLVICARTTVGSDINIDRNANLPGKSHVDGDQVLQSIQKDA